MKSSRPSLSLCAVRLPSALSAWLSLVFARARTVGSRHTQCGAGRGGRASLRGVLGPWAGFSLWWLLYPVTC